MAKKIERSGDALKQIDTLKEKLAKATAANDQEYIDYYTAEIGKVHKIMDGEDFEWDEEDFTRNKPALKAYKQFWESRNGKAWEGSNEDLAEDFKSTMGWFDYNLPMMGMLAAEADSWDDETLQSFSTMMKDYEKLDLGTWSTTKNVGRVALDPSSWIGISTLGAGTVAAQGVKLATKQGIKGLIGRKLADRAAKNKAKAQAAGTVYKNPLKGRVAATAAEGALYGGGYDAAKQEVEDPDAEYNVGRGVGAAALGGLIGGAIPIAGRGLSKGFKKVTGSDVAEQYGKGLNQHSQKQNALVEGALTPKGDVSKYTQPKGIFQEFGLPYQTGAEAWSTVKSAVGAKGTGKARNFLYQKAGDMTGLKFLNKAGALQELGKNTGLLKAITRLGATAVYKPSVLAGGIGKNRKLNTAFKTGQSIREELPDLVPDLKPYREQFAHLKNPEKAYQKAMEKFDEKTLATTRMLESKLPSQREVGQGIENSYRAFAKKNPLRSKIGRLGKGVDEFLDKERAKTTIGMPVTYKQVLDVMDSKDPIVKARADARASFSLDVIKQLGRKVKNGTATKSEKIRYKLSTDGTVSIKDVNLNKTELSDVMSGKSKVSINKKTGEAVPCPK